MSNNYDTVIRYLCLLSLTRARCFLVDSSFLLYDVNKPLQYLSYFEFYINISILTNYLYKHI